MTRSNTSSSTSARGARDLPDGTLVATVNMRGTALPEDSPEHADRRSVTWY